MKQIKFKTMIMAALATIAFSSCKDYIDEGSRYTFTGHTVASYLEENAETYSNFIEILRRGGRLSLMKAYGEYTCFAPTNDAVTKYLFEQDSIYWTSVEANQLDPSVDIVWTGITSPELSELSDSMCKVISQTHLLPAIYLTTDMEGNIIPTMNMNDRYLSLSFDNDEEGRSMLLINGTSEIIGRDEEVENGVVHTIATVLNPSTNTIPSQIGKHDYFYIFGEALEMTGYDDELQLYKDETYTDGDKTEENIDKSGERSPYPKNRYYGFTAFVEPDRVFNDAGIYNFEDLEEKCKEWYPHDGVTTDHNAPLTSKKNPVNQFVGYHLLDRKLPYARLVCYKIVVTGYFESEKDLQSNSDRHEYYETMNNRLMKVTMPRTVPSLQNTILINYSKATDDATEEQLACMNTVIYHPDDFKALDSLYANFDNEALNGYIHAIDKILIYNEDVMAGRVLNGIIRIDFSSLCSELTNNDIRWNHPGNRSTGDVYIPNDYCKNMRAKAKEESKVYYLSAHTSWSNYQGDEMMTLGAFDFEYKLPPVPAGTYEIRVGYSANSKRHIVQYYVDDEVTGIPVDMRLLGTSPIIDWVKDSSTEDNGVANDKAMKNRGYLKGPTTFSNYGEYTAGKARDDNSTFRKVITTKYLSEGEHWMRFKNVNENDDGTAQFMHDYLEIVPMTFIRDESLSLEEKRK